MISEIKFLDGIDVAAPCSAPWEGMTGDDRVRFCQDCKRKVFNLSDMTRKEAESLVRDNGAEGLCIRFYRRRDGTVLTDNCPVGLRAIRNVLLKRWAAVVSLAAALFHLPGSAKANTPPEPVRHSIQGFVITWRLPPYSGNRSPKAVQVVAHHRTGKSHAKDQQAARHHAKSSGTKTGASNRPM